MVFWKSKRNVDNNILEMLQKANQHSLQGRQKIIAVAILYENPNNIALPDNRKLASMLIEQYKSSGFIPHILSLEQNTPVITHQLIQGKEISPNAGLDTKGSNRLLSELFNKVLGSKGVKNASAIAFRGDSVALGQTFFAIIAK